MSKRNKMLSLLKVWHTNIPEGWVTSHDTNYTLSVRDELVLQNILNCAQELALLPVRKECRATTGLAKYERTTRRCVYPNGRTVPLLAYNSEDEPEYTEHKRLKQETDILFERKLRELGLPVLD